MQTYIVQSFQNIIDIAVQLFGDASAVVQIAKDNNIGITDNIDPGTVLQIDESKIISRTKVRFFKDENITIVTSF